MALPLPEFVHRWKTYEGTERSVAQPHFLDLCALRDQPSAACPLPPLSVLRALFNDPSLLGPDRTEDGTRSSRQVGPFFSFMPSPSAHPIREALPLTRKIQPTDSALPS